PNTQYSFKAKARNAIGAETVETATISTYTAAVAPTSSLAASTFSSITAYTFTLNWSSGASNTGFNPAYTDYVAHLSTASNFTGTIISSNTKNFNASGFTLTPDTTYYARVKGINVDGVDTWYTSFGSSMTHAAVETSPLYSTYTSVFSSSFTLQWDSGTIAGGYNHSGTRYVAEISSMSSFTPLWFSSSTLNIYSTYTALSLNTTYFARVRGLNAIGAYSAYTDFGSTVTLATAPVASSLYSTFTAVYASSFTVNWDSGTQAGGFNPSSTRYLAEISTKSNFTPLWDSSSTLNISATFTALTANTTYYARVKAVNHRNVPTDYLSSASTMTAIETPTDIIFDEITSSTITASAYASAFTNMGVGQTGIDIAKGGVYEAWHLGGDSWVTKTAVTTGRSYLAVVALGGKVYAIGGDDGSAGNKNEAYDPVANNWAVKAVLPTARRDLGAAVYIDKIYAIGGYLGASVKSANEAYDPVANSWVTKAAMPTARDSLSVASVGGKIYAIGGSNDAYGVDYDANEEYDPVSDQWATKAVLPTARYWLPAAAAVVSGKIYVVGGATQFDVETKNEEYNPAANTWVTKAPLPAARALLATVGVGGKVYAIGGMDNGFAAVNVNEVFDPALNSWVTKTVMPTARIAPAGAFEGGKIYVVGGEAQMAENEAYDPGVATQFAGLSPNTQYSFKAKARNAIGAETVETAT
ncbi:MAG: hypothetical protein HY611_07390, partial [Elusimicrobia bacterium]|nr:hypothetical protein [Elusimicrobiota bacterium]